MEKTRIVLDVDARLKELFLNRLKLASEDITLTRALKAAMYSMLEMDNRSLSRFIENGEGLDALYHVIPKRLAKAQEEGLLPKDYVVGNPKDGKIFAVLMNMSAFSGLREKAKQKIDEIVKEGD